MLRKYETVLAERTEDDLLGVYTLSPENIRSLSEEDLAGKRLDVDAARAVRCTV